MNKYTTWYGNIINSAKTNLNVGYTETHHIVPRSLGGSNDPSNLVDLSARQHFICHWLLTKIHTGQDRGKMINALVMMQGESTHQHRYKTKITSRAFAKLREEYAAYISKMNTGSKLTVEQREKVRQSKLGKSRSFTTEWKENLGKNHKSKNGTYDCSLSDETKKKIGDKIRGRKHTDEEKKRRADAIRGMKREKKLCPHCNKEVAVNGYARWHGDNCKFKGVDK
jgi:hypothetical protein